MDHYTAGGHSCDTEKPGGFYAKWQHNRSVDRYASGLTPMLNRFGSLDRDRTATEACRRASSGDYAGERRRTTTPASSIDLGLGGTVCDASSTGAEKGSWHT
jgi:hypothetical protein